MDKANEENANYQPPSFEELKKSIRHHIRCTLARRLPNLSTREFFTAVSLAIRDTIIDRMMDTEERYENLDCKRVYYLSMEFLMGRSLGNNLCNLEIFDLCQEVAKEIGFNLQDALEIEPDAALGNGGLGRLAACFLDSMATLDIPGYGYGINYQFGLFQQSIVNNEQVEKPDHWLENGTPWEIERPDEAVVIPLYGSIEHAADRNGEYNPMWMNWKVVIGIPHDMPVVGYGGKTVNCLRLYSARSSHQFDMKVFNAGDYFRAVEQKISSETISKVLYPSDSVLSGRELRLIQEYFLVACATRDIIRRFKKQHDDFNKFPEYVAIQLNDTHPALTVAELMRTLVDEQEIPWEKSWELTRQTLGYTNHTLLPEALEKWPVSLMEKVLPRHMQLIYEMNSRFMEEVDVRWPNEPDRLGRMSLIEEGQEKQVRMAHMSIIGSHSVNGVSELHSELIKSSLVPDFYEMWPEKFNNKTNGVTQRRWLLKSNPLLASLITEKIGNSWISNLDRLRDLEEHLDDSSFVERFEEIKKLNKIELAKVIKHTNNEIVDVNSIFDVQIKRIHEYKRQLLNLMHIMHQYFCCIEDNEFPTVPRTYIFAGKAAPGYWAAKQIISLINHVAEVINNDKRVNEHLKVIFIPDYRVSLAEVIIPAANVSEQISTAGKEASGTGNMKFALNGALTVGTLDGANIEINEEVGDENIYIFGLRVEEVKEMRTNRSYNPGEHYRQNPYTQRVLDAMCSNIFCEDPDTFSWIYRSLVGEDTYFHLADLPSYIDIQKTISEDYRDSALWNRKSILNVARVGKFSSDRTILEYAADIWKVKSSI